VRTFRSIGADRESTEAKVRTKIKRLLRKHKYRPAGVGAGGGGHDLNHYIQLVLDQAKAKELLPLLAGRRRRRPPLSLTVNRRGSSGNGASLRRPPLRSRLWGYW
jgi:hypothetical protein